MRSVLGLALSSFSGSTGELKKRDQSIKRSPYPKVNRKSANPTCFDKNFQILENLLNKVDFGLILASKSPFFGRWLFDVKFRGAPSGLRKRLENVHTKLPFGNRRHEVGIGKR